MATAIAAYGLGSVVGQAMNTLEAAIPTGATPWLYDLMPGGTRERSGTHYGAGIIRAAPQDNRDKQRASKALNSEAEVGIRIMLRLRADNLREDHEAASQIGDIVISLLIDAADTGAGSTPAQKWLWLETKQRVVADGTYLLIEQRYRCYYQTSTSL